MTKPSVCLSCGAAVGRRWSGYCRTPCYQRWLRAGRPAPGTPKPLTDMERWRQLPVIEAGREPTNVEVGSAGEHLVCADLLLSGYVAFLTDQGCAYDVAVDLGGRLIRLQVKSTRVPNTARGGTPSYEWHVRRHGSRGIRKYPEGAFDLLALVALDVRLVAYTPPSPGNMARIQHSGTGPGRRFSDFPFGRALAQLGNVPEMAEHRRRAGEEE